MKFDEITSRITGLSWPVFGVSWTPPEPDRKVGGRVIAFLEDRRVLYAPSEIEIPFHCVDSVLQIREYLTHELQGLDRDTPLAATLRALRAACRKFLDTIGPMQHRYGFIDHAYHGWVFIAVLGGVTRLVQASISPPATASNWKTSSPPSYQPQPTAAPRTAKQKARPKPGSRL